MTPPSEKTHRVIEQIFKNYSLQYGLQEFVDYQIDEILTVQEKEPHRFYLKDIKTGVDRFVFDSQKQTAKPEEVVRQLWLYETQTVVNRTVDNCRLVSRLVRNCSA